MGDGVTNVTGADSGGESEPGGGTSGVSFADMKAMVRARFLCLISLSSNYT